MGGMWAGRLLFYRVIMMYLGTMYDVLVAWYVDTRGEIGLAIQT